MFALQLVEIVGIVGPSADVVMPGAFVKSYDPDAFDGRGSVTWTTNPADALTFDSFAAAMDCWRQPSSVRPLREDGKMNRPLTACSILVLDVSVEHVDREAAP